MKWTVESITSDWQTATLTRPVKQAIHVGRNYEIEKAPKWGRGNYATVLELLPTGARCMVENVDIRRAVNGRKMIGEHVLPYTAFVEEWL